jgi:A/G-specific adenine glycosylase
MFIWVLVTSKVMIAKAKIASVRKRVLAHYKKYKRNLPWRKTTNPYHILLSEIMLQQTQVDRVIPYYNRWLKKWPTVHDLAKASRISVLKIWLGLGYNNRAKNLHETAKVIVEKYNGDVLKALEQYKELPGVGPYTAAAVQIFSGNKNIVTVDTNIRRILIHEFNLNKKIKDKEVWALAEKCLPRGRSREWHNALMDYGATLMTSRKTGIKPKTTQSAFEGSDRQIRANIVREVLKGKGASYGSLLKIAEKDKERFKRILEKMMREKLIRKRGSSYSIVD